MKNSEFEPYGGDALYIISDERAGAIKVGRGDPESRLAKFQCGNANQLKLRETIPFAGFIEPLFHSMFADFAVRRGSEWYPTSSLPAWVIHHWNPHPVVDMGTALQTFGEAVHIAMRAVDVMDDQWTDHACWSEFSVSNFRWCVDMEIARRDEHHRRAAAFADACRRHHGEAPELAPLPVSPDPDIREVMADWEDVARHLTDRWERRDEIAEHDRSVQEFLRREREEAING